MEKRPLFAGTQFAVCIVAGDTATVTERLVQHFHEVCKRGVV